MVLGVPASSIARSGEAQGPLNLSFELHQYDIHYIYKYQTVCCFYITENIVLMV